MIRRYLRKGKGINIWTQFEHETTEELKKELDKRGITKEYSKILNEIN